MQDPKRRGRRPELKGALPAPGPALFRGFLLWDAARLLWGTDPCLAFSRTQQPSIFLAFIAIARKSRLPSQT